MKQTKYETYSCENSEWNICLEDVFPNPTDEQVKLWNESYGGTKDHEPICQGWYYELVINSLQERMIDELEESEVQ